MVLNRFTREDLRRWVNDSRVARRSLSQRGPLFIQQELQFEPAAKHRRVSLSAGIRPPERIPQGPKIIGIDLTAGEKPTGVAVLDGLNVDTCSLRTDDDILGYVADRCPAVVSIDSPLGLPGGGETIRRSAGIMRVAEEDLASIGIPAYPALIDSMKNLTLRGIRLRRMLEANGTAVIESYPGAAQDILCLPRKQRGLELLRDGLRRLGLFGRGLETRSHDEMDAITAAIVGRYHQCGAFEPMGIAAEAQLIVPKISPLAFDDAPIICLAGKTGAGKSVVARYLSVFYGFNWLKTRDVIRELLIEDLQRPVERRWLKRKAESATITEKDLRDFGALILTEHNQEPLRARLTQKVTSTRAPIVVDAIRDAADVDQDVLGERPFIIWFVDCSEKIIRDRLLDRSKRGRKRLPTASPVDRTAETLKEQATSRVSNDTTLEGLRWRLDDAIFAITEVRTSVERIVA
jgi:predicted nuclease with RNAse H fold/dephospho-CoA kinase